MCVEKGRGEGGRNQPSNTFVLQTNYMLNVSITANPIIEFVYLFTFPYIISVAFYDEIKQ